MLTSDLLEVTISGKEITPKFISPHSRGAVEKAERILEIFDSNIGSTRGAIQAALQDTSALEVRHKLFKGLGKIAMDQAVFQIPELAVEPKIEPKDLRRMVFETAAKCGPVSLGENQLGRPSKIDILSQISRDISVEIQDFSKFLYADYREMHILEERPSFSDAEQLLWRYNLSLCQAILYRATSIRIRLISPSSAWLAMIFRRIKFYRLMFQAYQRDQVVELKIDGPQSLLKQSSRYGIQFALFLPVLPLLPFQWELQADILWGKKRKTRKNLFLHSEMGLKSHYKARGVWKSNTEEWFETRYLEKEREWQLQEGRLISLGGQQVLLPNFTFVKEDSIAYLEIIGFWQKSFLKELVLKSPKNVIFAVSRKYAGESQGLPPSIQKRVLSFAEVIPVNDIIGLLNATLSS